LLLTMRGTIIKTPDQPGPRCPGKGWKSCVAPAANLSKTLLAAIPKWHNGKVRR
jgi:hypothetical protein